MKNNWKKVDVEIEGETLCEEYKRKQETAPGEQENPYLKKLEDIQKVWKERGIGNTNDSTPGDECGGEKKELPGKPVFERGNNDDTNPDYRFFNHPKTFNKRERAKSEKERYTEYVKKKEDVIARKKLERLAKEIENTPRGDVDDLTQEEFEERLTEELDKTVRYGALKIDKTLLTDELKRKFDYIMTELENVKKQVSSAQGEDFIEFRDEKPKTSLASEVFEGRDVPRVKEKDIEYFKTLSNFGKAIKGYTTVEAQKPIEEVEDKIKEFTNSINKFRMNIKDGDMTMEDDMDKNTPLATNPGEHEQPFLKEPKKDFDSIAKDICDLHRKKNSDYGDAAYESYKEFGITSYVIRLGDKYRRLQSLTSPGKEQQVKSESIQDTLMDLAAYAIMAIEAINKK